MDLKIYEEENKLRQTPEKIDDESLIVWDVKEHNTKILVSDDKFVVAKSNAKSTDTIFIESKDFNMKFYNLTGGMLSYINWENLVVAGGSVSNTINNECSTRCVSDIDLFLYGLNESEGKAKIEEIINTVRLYCEEQFNTDLHILKNKYVISLIPDRLSKRIHKVQIITRLYKCVYEILAGFDIDSSAVAYNGRDVLLTLRSLNAFKTRYNVVDMSRRSPSYESRLYKYYKRGFGIYIPFEFKSKNNKLYFINPKSMGVDKLMYLLKYTKTRNFNKFLNIMTQRINKRLRFNHNSSNYETEEFTFENGDIRNDIIRYNKKVSDEFKLKLYNKYSKVSNSVKFITQNPGQQLTGSFAPVTEEGWIDVDYSKRGMDFLGRSSELLNIKAGKQVRY